MLINIILALHFGQAGRSNGADGTSDDRRWDWVMVLPFTKRREHNTLGHRYCPGRVPATEQVYAAGNSAASQFGPLPPIALQEEYTAAGGTPPGGNCIAATLKQANGAPRSCFDPSVNSIARFPMRSFSVSLAIAAFPALIAVHPAAAQSFDDRWSIIPKAHAEPAPPAPDNSSVPAPSENNSNDSSEVHRSSELRSAPFLEGRRSTLTES